jgi:hypothetical protein
MIWRKPTPPPASESSAKACPMTRSLIAMSPKAGAADGLLWRVRANSLVWSLAEPSVLFLRRHEQNRYRLGVDGPNDLIGLSCQEREQPVLTRPCDRPSITAKSGHSIGDYHLAQIAPKRISK